MATTMTGSLLIEIFTASDCKSCSRAKALVKQVVEDIDKNNTDNPVFNEQEINDQEINDQEINEQEINEQEINYREINYREINVVDNIDYAVALGVLRTPAIALNGELVFALLPSRKALEDAIKQRIK